MARPTTSTAKPTNNNSSRKPTNRKKKTKKALEELPKRPVFVAVESPSKENVTEPDYSFRINTREKCLVARVHLSRVPGQLITCDPTNERFKCDTLKYSTKFKLDVEYPSGVTVDADKSTAEWENGVLTCRLPITELSEEAKDRQRKVSGAIREEASLRMDPRLPHESRVMKKVDRKALRLAALRKKHEKAHTQRRSAKQDEKAALKQQQKDAKKPKVFVEGKDRAMEIAANMARQHEEGIAKKQQQTSVIAQARAERRARQEEKREKRQAVRNKAKARVEKKRKRSATDQQTYSLPPLAAGESAETRPNKKRRVSFGATNDVEVFKD